MVEEPRKTHFNVEVSDVDRMQELETVEDLAHEPLDGLLRWNLVVVQQHLELAAGCPTRR